MDLNIDALMAYAHKPAVPAQKEGERPFCFLPDGYEIRDIESMLPKPVRKRATVVMNDTPSFVKYVKKHGSLDCCTLYADTSFEKQSIRIVGIINDHGSDPDSAQWRDHAAIYEPEKTVEWKRWNTSNGRAMTQEQFATFLEDNLGDIREVNGSPSGTDMLTMATQFEANADKRFKSKIGLQGGGVTMEFVSTDDAATLSRMKVFERFTIAIGVFVPGVGGDDVPLKVYPIQARLKYRQQNDKLTFWYELIRPDTVFALAVRDELTAIVEKTGFPLLNGNPGS